ncbi:hypothetical protein [Paenibacillus woosongensis]|uniref:Uncharacterized protein n=1 Tax=Paenibacillus woosongensis TaxID=307580 RepID=A0ABQ4MRP9_9BACL|nr:hypothetical protein [Paenibacillus woosongensis]GIP58680.1 hypothetical protein J15TS10_24940 [Paenibacillus woosongensis]
MNGWFQFVSPESNLQQGDILFQCPVFFPNPEIDYAQLSNPAEVSFELKLKDVIVMTQSCDIQQGKPLMSVLLCPIAGLEQVAKDGQLANLVSDRINNMHLLNKHDSKEGSIDYKIIDFSQVYTVPLGVLKNWKSAKTERIPRLLSPYTEHMSQRFGIKMMRVGTDDNLKVNLDELRARWNELKPPK